MGGVTVASTLTSPTVSYTKGTPTMGGTVVIEEEETFSQKWLVMPKMLYFLLNIFVYAFHGLMPIFFLEEWKFKYWEYGYASSIIATNFFGAMLWSSLADKTGKYKTIIIVTSFMYTLAALSLLIPVFQKSSDVVWRYLYVYTGLGLFNFFLSASFPLLDAQILGMLAANPKVNKEQFGFQRMFGAFGHLAATMLSMGLYSIAGKGITYGIKNKSWAQIILQMIISFVFMMAVWLAVPDVKPVKGGHHGAPIPSAKTEKVENADGADANEEVKFEEPIQPRSPVLTLMASPNFLFFMLFVAFSGIVRAVSTNFQKPIVYAIFHHNAFVTASIDIARVFSEVFVYATAKYLRAFMGVYWVLVFSQMTGIIRLAGYGLVNVNSWMAKPVAVCLELLKGFNSGLISSSAIIIASNLAPAGCESTAQGLYSGMYSGLSMAVGGIISGAILQIMYRSPSKPADYDTLTGDAKVAADKALMQKDKQMQTSNVQTMFIYVSIASTVITVLLCMKYVFIDRVMGIPGFPRRQ